jgi:hypothetical protein
MHIDGCRCNVRLKGKDEGSKSSHTLGSSGKTCKIAYWSWRRRHKAWLDAQETKDLSACESEECGCFGLLERYLLYHLERQLLFSVTLWVNVFILALQEKIQTRREKGKVVLVPQARESLNTCHNPGTKRCRSRIAVYHLQ